jgi:hypothetical protein
MKGRRNMYRLLVGRSEEKRRLGRSSCRWMNYIEMDLEEIAWGSMDWISLSLDRNN